MTAQRSKAVGKSLVTILALILVVLSAVGCGGNQQASEDTTEDQATNEDTQRTQEAGDKDTNGKAREQRATLELQGDPGIGFSGSCTVGNEEPEEVNGEVPESFTYELEGRPLECEISSDDDVQIDLRVGDNVHSIQRISGGTLNLTYKNGSVSSVVSSSGSGGQASSSTSRGSMTSESRDVSGFDEVQLNGIGNLSIEQTGSESLTVEAEEDVIPKLRTEVQNGRLIIGPKPNTTINTLQPIKYKLTVKDLKALEVAGSGDVEAEGISTDELAITVKGAGDVKMAGSAESQDIDISGSGDYQAGDLESKAVKIDVGGSGSAVVNVSDELDAKVRGSGSVEYIGDPVVNQDVRGFGRVTQH